MEWTCTGSYRRHTPPLDPPLVPCLSPLPLPLSYSILLLHFLPPSLTPLHCSVLPSSTPVNIFTLFQSAARMHEDKDEEGDVDGDGDDVGRALIVSTTNASIPLHLYPNPCSPTSVPIFFLFFSSSLSLTPTLS